MASRLVHIGFVPIYKKGSAVKCDNVRTISLIVHANKILLIKSNTFIKTQPDISSRIMAVNGEQMLNVNQINGKEREHQVIFLLYFLEYNNASDYVCLEQL